MTRKFLQLIMGSNNKQAGRDFIEYHFDPHPIRFYEEDIKNIIYLFSKEISLLKEVVNCTKYDSLFKHPGIEHKNEINNLSDEYFNYIKKKSYNYFNKIQHFLEDDKNEDIREKYFETANELNNKIKCLRKEFDYFEKIFDNIYSYIVEKNSNKLPFDKGLIWIFLHYMYCNCDIGDKEDDKDDRAS